MFRIVYDPSSGSMELYLTEITRSGSLIFVLCLVCVWQRNFEPVVCVYGSTCWELAFPKTFVLYTHIHTHTHTHTHTTGSKLGCQTQTKHTTNICEPQRIISVKYSSIFPNDGSHTIRNMLE